MLSLFRRNCEQEAWGRNEEQKGRIGEEEFILKWNHNIVQETRITFQQRLAVKRFLGNFMQQSCQKDQDCMLISLITG